MIFPMFVVLEIICIAFFLISFFSKQILLWAITVALTGVLAVTSYSVEYYTYGWNSTINAYSPVMMTFSYPYLMGINVLFFGLSIALLLYDIFWGNPENNPRKE